MRLLALIVLAGLVVGCTRAHYRTQADRESYGAIRERNGDPRWSLPRISVNTPPVSRLYDPFNPDRPPLPPDDPAAYRYMVCPNGIHGSRRWHKDGDAPWIEDPEWRNSLNLDKDGVLVLNPDRAVELGLLNSREYQTQIEQVYLDALALTFQRFEFDLHWFLTNNTFFTHFGSGADESNTLTTSSTFGFTKLFAAGGQLMMEFANTFVFQFAGSPDNTVALSNILVNFTQPLLRGFGRKVRLEQLTQAERNLLYQIRTFAHFRKQFTFNVATSQYMQLLLLQQSIRNQEGNIKQLQQSYTLHEALLASGLIDALNAEQIFSQLQNARAALIQSQAGLETSLDQYKITLGLPPSVPIRLDDSVLDSFQLTAPELDALQEQLERFQAHYREFDKAPSLAELQEGFKNLQLFHTRIVKLVTGVKAELDRWQVDLANRSAERNKDQLLREQQALRARARDLEDLRQEMSDLEKAIAKDIPALPKTKPDTAWGTLLTRSRFENDAALQLNVIQTQIRVYLIKLRPVNIELNEATDYAFANRLDLMNEQALVVDAWRKITVAANALEADFNVYFNADIATKPSGDNPFDFRSSASSYTVGAQFNAPLNRVAERNAYRASLINYQQLRRNYMALHDQIEESVRIDLRDLNTQRLNFEISRSALISAARQVEYSREQLLVQQGTQVNPTATLNTLNALQSVLTAKNTLIQNWISYETDRYRLFLDMEALQLDARGLYIDEYNNRPENAAATQHAPAGNPPQQPAP
jgi:outer membrane protein TolC